MLFGSSLLKSILGLDGDAKAPDTSNTVSFPANPKVPRKYEPHRDAIQRHIDLDLKFDIAEKTVAGTATLVFELKNNDLQEIEIDAKEMRVTKVSLAVVQDPASQAQQIFSEEFTYAGKHDLDYIHCDDKLNVKGIAEHLKAIRKTNFFALTIHYSLRNPRAGLYFINTDDFPWVSTPCIWTQGQDVDASFWFPCQDDPRLKVTTRIKLDTPRDWLTESNGEKIGKNCWVMKSPHARADSSYKKANRKLAFL